MKKIVIFGGTSEGRLLAKYCDENFIPAIVCVATEYGTELLEEYKNISVSEGRKDEEAMKKLFLDNNVEKVYDATHPYAKIVSENIIKVCNELKLEYVRILRDSKVLDKTLEKYYKEFENIEEVVDYLKDKNEKVLIATGSKELYKYKDLEVKNLYPRVLANMIGIKACEDIGIPSSNIIAMQGPFDIDTNVALLKKYACKYLITKESGDIGGFSEKIEACKKVDAKALVIKRPTKEEGISLEEAISGLKDLKYDIEEVKNPNILEAKKVNISIVGLGMGSIDSLTIESAKKIENASFIIGAKRMLEICLNMASKEVKTYISYKPTDILDYIYEKAGEEDKIVLVMSGDTGFYSGSIKLKKEFEEYTKKGYFEENSKLEICAGISSFSYMCAKFGIDYTDMKILSVHGRDENLNELFDSIKFNKKTFALSSGDRQINDILAHLVENELGEVEVLVAENMSSKNERYFRNKASELVNEKFDKISSLIFINEKAKDKRVLFGIDDEEFLRDKVPMTKSDIRALAMAKLELSEAAICYDIGAGSGSCSIEMGRFASKGKVYAIEHKKIACDLIEKNIKKFSLKNIEVIFGEASEKIEDIEAPSHVFIGGSGGDLELIVDKIYKKNENATVVITAITLETIACINEIVKKYANLGYKYDMSFISFANNKTVANYNMMIGGNPVLIARIKR
jgi:hypothetical protein